MLEEAFQQFERLPGELAQEIPHFDTEFKSRLAQFAVDAADRGKADGFLSRAIALEKKKGPLLWAGYLEAQLCNQLNRLEDWERELLRVADRLSQASAWDAAHEIADEILASHPSPAATRLIVRAAEASGDDATLEGALEQAWSMDAGNPEIALRLAGRALARGDASASLEWRGAALKGLAEADDWAALDEAMLAVLEGDEPTSHASAIETLGLLYRGGQAAKAAEYMELGQARWGAPPFPEKLLAALRAAAERGHADEPLRRGLVFALKSMHGNFAELDEYLGLSGLASPGADIPAALKTWDQLWAYRRGTVVEHGTLGLGIIGRNDGTRLQIAFATSPEHSMTLVFAQKSLTLIPEHHLKAQLARDRAGTLARFATDPAGVLADALQDLGGTAKNTDVKKYLTHLGFPASSFAAWWKKAKAAAADHPRLDDHEAYRDIMHLVKEGAAGEIRLPVLDVKKGPRAAVTLVTRFLTQHPGAAEQARRRYAPHFQEWLADPAQPESDRAVVLMALSRWFPEDNAGWGRIAASLDATLVGAPAWGSPVDQKLWIELLAGDMRWSETLPPFLGSRKAEVRREARQLLAERWGDRTGVELLRVMQRATDLPEAALALCTEALNEPELPSWTDAWHVAIAVLSLLEGKTEESLAKDALRVIDIEDGRLVKLVKDVEPDADQASTLDRLVRYWRSSDRYFFPALDFLRGTKVAHLVTEAEERRAEEMRRLEIPSAEADAAEIKLMTRETFERMVRELERLNRDLKTVIPQAIRKARELGDLRENAEYDAAKLKQRQATQRCEQLEKAIRQVRLIEDQDINGDSVMPGTEVRLEGPSGARVLWILGEGDNHHGDDVVSYRAAVGRVVQGRKVGDPVKLPVDGVEMEYVVKSIRKRLPEVSPGA